LTIVGDGPSRSRLKELAKAKNLSARIKFAGWKERAELPQFFKETNLFVYPSRHEGMPNAVLEAMASGLPVVATRIAGNEDLVSEHTGQLVPAEDATALRLALETLITDAQGRERMGAAARRHVEAHFGWHQVAGKYMDLIERVTRMA
jgi:glycosyltransferase involved in cell wall biosynthesis